MRSFIPLFLLILLLLAPFTVRWTLLHGRQQQTPAPQAANRLVIVTPNNQDIRWEFARAFSQWHTQKFGQPVAIDYRTPGGTNDIIRLLNTTYDAMRRNGKLPPPNEINTGIDLVWGGGDVIFDRDLKSRGILQPIALDPAILRAAFPQKTLGGIKLYDQSTNAAGQPLPPQWIGVCLSSFGIIYNPDLYATLNLPPPQHWSDLADPHLAGMIALADPTHSGSVAVAYMMVIQRAMADAEAAFPQLNAFQAAAKTDWKQAQQSLPPAEYQSRLAQYESLQRRYHQQIAIGWKHGMQTLTRIAANARYFTASASQVTNDVGNGEAAAGVAIDFYARTNEQILGPSRLQYILPPAATAITPDPVAILYGVKDHQKILANHFVQFLLSPQGQRLWVLKAGAPGGPVRRSLRRTPIRRDIYTDQTHWTDTVNPFALAGGFNLRPQWMSLFSDIRPLWAAAWIDSREALKSAYAQILSLPNSPRRKILLDELSTPPLTLFDLQQAKSERQHTPKSQLNDWIARRRIRWANLFRAHYAAVAAKADPAL